VLEQVNPNAQMDMREIRRAAKETFTALNNDGRQLYERKADEENRQRAAQGVPLGGSFATGNARTFQPDPSYPTSRGAGATRGMSWAELEEERYALAGPVDPTVVYRHEFLSALQIPKSSFNKEWLAPNKKAWREKRKAKWGSSEDYQDYSQGTRQSARRSTGNRNMEGEYNIEMPKPRRPGQNQPRPALSNRPKRAKTETKPAPVIPRGPARPTTILGFDARQRLTVEHYIEAFGVPQEWDTVRVETGGTTLAKKTTEQMHEYGAALLKNLLVDAAEVGGAAGSKKVTSRIATTHLLKEKLSALHSVEPRETKLEIVKAFAEEAGMLKSRAVTWGPVQDLLLLEAVIRQGWGNWKEVCTDNASGLAMAVMHHFGLPVERRRAFSKELCALLPARPSASHGCIRRLNELIQETTPEFKDTAELFAGERLTFARRTKGKSKKEVAQLTRGGNTKGPVDERDWSQRSKRGEGDALPTDHAGFAIIQDPTLPGGNKQAGKKETVPVRWTDDEQASMLRGVIKYSCNWKDIKKDSLFGPILARRNNIKLKDKWRNLQTSSAKDIERIVTELGPVDAKSKEAVHRKYARIAEYLLEKAGLTDRVLFLPGGGGKASEHVYEDQLRESGTLPEVKENKDNGRGSPAVGGGEDDEDAFEDPEAKKKKKRKNRDSNDMLLGAEALDEVEDLRVEQNPDDDDEDDDDDDEPTGGAVKGVATTTQAQDDDLVLDIMAASGSRTANGRVGAGSGAIPKDALDTAWIEANELVWCLNEGRWWPAKVVGVESTWIDKADFESGSFPSATVQLLPLPVEPEIPTPEKKRKGGDDEEDEEGMDFEEPEALGVILAPIELVDQKIRPGLQVQPFREAYKQVTSSSAFVKDEALDAALAEAAELESKMVDGLFKPDSRLLKRFADYCESRCEMIAEAIVLEHVGEEDVDDHASEDEELEAYEIAMRQALGNVVTTGYNGSEAYPEMLRQDAPCVAVQYLDLNAQNVVTTVAAPGVRFKLKPHLSSNKDVQVVMSVGETEPSDTWPCCLKILVGWHVMVKLLKVKENELWLKHDTMDGIVDASAVHVAGGYPVRERLNKLQLRNPGTSKNDSNKAKNDIYFVLPDCLQTANTVAIEAVDAREIARTCETSWQSGRAMPGDIELWRMSQIVREGPRFVAESFSQLTAAAQRATVHRLFLETKQSPHDTLMCSLYHPVSEAMYGECLEDPRPHPAKCAKFCQGLICPACLCCCTGFRPHCVTACTGEGRLISCTKADTQLPLTELSWWFPESTMGPAGGIQEYDTEEEEDEEEDEEEGERFARSPEMGSSAPGGASSYAGGDGEAMEVDV